MPLPVAPRRRVLAALAALTPALTAALTAALPTPGWAQAWLAKPVTIVVPFPAGGGTDAFARPLFATLTKNTGKQFIIDNKGGAGGTLGAGLASRAAPDGYTFFMGAVHHAIAPAVYPKLDYNLQADFVPVGLIASVPQVIVVNPQRVAANTLPELLEHLRKNPGKVNFGSAGNGTSHHLAGELFKLQTKTFITHIPYRGAGPALQDLAAGQVDLMFDGLGSSATHIKSGRIKALAVAADKPAPGFGQVPLAKDGGAPNYLVSTWYGLWAPKNTPKEIVAAMAAEMKKALASEELKALWTGLGAETPNLWGDDFGKFVGAETRRWGEVVRAAHIKLD
ncbi:MAG: tripartite tricarboxylate transporter substrate binding protein [Burkholderiales bacterium]|nr:tripartite tricarboxylate transporter substrate binding protein [Burkholderiales bacterium]